MIPIELADPAPRSTPLPYRVHPFVTTGQEYLEAPLEHCGPDVLAVMKSRRCRREFRKLTGQNRSELLWYTAKASFKGRRDGFVTRQHRPIPSAGGLHPIDLVWQQNEGAGHTLALYDAVGHSFRTIAADSAAVARLRRKLNSVLDSQAGDIVWLIADFAKVRAVYENSTSLVWRDVGVLIGALCIVAEALCLAACPVGICGDSWIREVLPLPDEVHCVGAVVVGGRESRDECFPT